MKKLLPLFIALFILLPFTLEAQRYEWLKIYSSSGFSANDQYLEVFGNNVYVTGEFAGTISFGSTVLTSTGSRDVYLANYDTLGNFQWAVKSGGTSSFDDILDIDIDDAGNIYLLGTFNNTISWGSQSLNQSNASSFREGYIVKLNDRGVAQWIRGIYSPTTSFSFRGVVDLSVATNKLFVAGQQISDIRFSGSSITLSQSGGGGFTQNNVYVGELDLNGVPLALNRIVTANSSVSNSNSIGDIEAVNDSVFYFSGLYRGQFTFGSNNVAFATSTSFVLGLARFTNYSCDWLVRPSATSSGFTSSVPQIAIAPNEDVYLASTTSGTLVIQSNTINPPPGFTTFSRYIYALKVNSAGSVQSLVNFNSQTNIVADVDLNAKKEFLISGEFSDSVLIGGRKTFSNGSFGSDHLILNLDSNLSPNWYQTGGGGNSDQALSIASDQGKSSMYVSGNFRGLSQFGTTFFTGNNAFTTSILYKLDECANSQVPLTFTGDTNLCVGEDVRIFANPPAAATFQWLRDSVQLAGEIFRDLQINTEGNYQVIVNGSGCLDTSRAVRVNVDTLPIVTFTLVDTVCQQDAPKALSGGFPAGGVYRGPGVVGNTFDPSITGIGTFQIRYVFANGGCADSATSTIFVKPAPTVFFAPLSNICITSGPITLTNAFPFGGTFSGNGVTGNQFDPVAAGGGFTDITYTFTDLNGCVGTAVQTIEVDTLPSVSFNVIPDICINASLYTLSEGVPAGGVYSGPGVVNGQFDPSITGIGTFSIDYTLANQCGTSTSSQSITVITAPTVSLGSFADLCESDASIVLTGGSPSGGIYSGTGVSAGSFDPVVSGVGTFTIFYSFTSANGCIATDSSTITVNPLPTTSITPNSEICLGSSINLSASGGSTYLWNTTATTSVITVSPTVTTNYSVTITSAAGCSEVENVIVTVNPLPTASISGVNTICDGDNTTLTAAGGQNYLWSNSSTSSSITVSPSSTTTYTVTVTDVNGCTDTESETVTVNPLPNVTLGSFADLCEDDAAITLGGGSPAGGTYSGVGVSAGSFDPVVSGVGTFTIFYDFIDAVGCANRASSTITVNPKPITSISPDTDICLGSSTTLTASGGSTYVWSTSASTASVTVSPTTTTTYSVTITSAAGCSEVENVVVTVNPLPVASISGSNTICDGGNTTLTASGGQTYVWSTSATTAGITVSPNTTTTYTVTVTDANGCTDTESETVTVNPLPTVSLGTFSDLCEGGSAITLSGGSPAGGTYSGVGVSSGTFDPVVSGAGTFTIFYDFTDAIGCSNRDSSTITVNPTPSTSISPSPSICEGSSTTLTATGGTSYLWSTTATTPSITVSPTSTTNYSVTITAATGCTNTETVSVFVNPLPTASISGVATICDGDNTTLTASGGQTYVWSNSATTAGITVSPNTTTTYSVTVTDANGCTDTENQIVTVNPKPTTVVSPDTAICLGDSVQLSISSASGTYSWSTSQSGSQIVVAPLNTTLYTVTTTSPSQCTRIDSILVTINTSTPVNIGPDTTLDPVIATSITYDAGATPISYLWQDNSTAQTLTVTYNAAKAGLTDTISVIATNASGCPSVDTALVFYDFPSGIDNNMQEISSIVVSPNPTTDLINIRFSKRVEANRRLQLFDLKGKLVMDEVFNGNEELIVINLLDTKVNKGVYLLSIEENGLYFREKIVVQ